MNGYLASGFAVSGGRGWLVLLALILFGVAAVVSYVSPSHRLAMVLVAAGLTVFMLSLLWT